MKNLIISIAIATMALFAIACGSTETEIEVIKEIEITKEIETFPWEKLDFVSKVKTAFEL